MRQEMKNKILGVLKYGNCMKNSVLMLIILTAAFVSIGLLWKDSFGIYFLIASVITSTSSLVLAIKNRKDQSKTD